MSAPFADRADVVHDSADRERWLTARRSGIGASEIAAVLGEDPRRSPVEVWAEKTGRVEPRDLAAEFEFIEWGLILEGAVVGAYGSARYSGRESDVDGTLYRSRRVPWAQATLDAWTVHPVHGRIPLQIKTTSPFAVDAWSDGLPEPVWWQEQQEMMVVDAPAASVACLVGGQRLIWIDVERDAMAQRRIEHVGNLFWEMVRRGEMPKVDGTASCTRIIREIYGKAEPGTEIDLGPEGEVWDEVWLAAHAAEKEAKTRKEEAANHLRALIGECEVGYVGETVKWSNKVQRRAEYVVPANEFRVLRRSESKR